MRKAQSERPRQEARTPGSSASALGWLDPAPWLGVSGVAWKEGVKWMELWQRETQRMWGMGAMTGWGPLMGTGLARGLGPMTWMGRGTMLGMGPMMGMGPMLGIGSTRARGPGMSAEQGAHADGDRRRVSDMPWVPRLEAQVIPLRRNTDPPGGEATRFSMRVPLPWTDGSTNIVSIETILGVGEGGEGGEGGEREKGESRARGEAQIPPGARRG